MSEYRLGATGSMDIAIFLNSILPDYYPQVIMDELIAISKLEISNLMEQYGAIASEWSIEDTWLQSEYPTEIDVFFIWWKFKHRMTSALHELLSECWLQLEVSKVMEMYHEK